MDDDTRQASDPNEANLTDPESDQATVPTSPALEEQAQDEAAPDPGEVAQYEGDGNADELAGGFTTPDVELPELEVADDEEGGDDVDTVARDAGTGQFVTDEYAAEHPDTTVVETVDREDPDEPPKLEEVRAEHAEMDAADGEL